MTVPSSLVVMVPSPSLSNKEKASLNSAGVEVKVRGYITVVVQLQIVGYVRTLQSGPKG